MVTKMSKETEKRKYMSKEVAGSLNWLYSVAGDKEIEPTLAILAAQKTVESAPEEASWYVQTLTPFLSNEIDRNEGELGRAALNLIRGYVDVFANGVQLSTMYDVLKDVGYTGKIPTQLDDKLTIAEALREYGPKKTEKEEETEEKPKAQDEDRFKVLRLVDERLRENTKAKFFDWLTSRQIEGLEKKIMESEKK